MSLMGRIVISCYTPKKGKEAALEALTKTHVDRLRAEGLVTERIPIIMKSKIGSIIEVFEWKSTEAIQQAHTNSKIQEMWQEYSEVCEYSKPCDMDEFNQLFSEFEPLN